MIKRMCIYMASIIFSLLGIVALVIFTPTEFEDSFPICIQRKYDTLVNREDTPSVILIGDSSMAFGVDAELLSELMGMPVINLGLQGGLGTDVLINMVEAHCQEGDIVVLARQVSSFLSELGLEVSASYEIMLTGFDGRPELLRYISLENYDEMIDAFPIYAIKKMDNYIAGTNRARIVGTYSIDSFDEKENMILERKEWTNSKTYDPSWCMNIRAEGLHPKCVEQINKYNERLSEKGVKLYISFHPMIDTLVTSTDEELEKFVSELSSRVDATVISNPVDYIYPIDYFFDVPLHCNELGAERRTVQLSEDLKMHMEGCNGI